jgi:hypothetical protein
MNIELEILREIKDIEGFHGSYFSIEEVADFFEVNKDTIKWHLKTKRDDFKGEANIVKGVWLKHLKSAYEKISNKASVFTIISPKGVIHLGMELKDSNVAKIMREYVRMYYPEIYTRYKSDVKIDSEIKMMLRELLEKLDR